MSAVKNKKILMKIMQLSNSINDIENSFNPAIIMQLPDEEVDRIIGTLDRIGNALNDVKRYTS